MYTSKLGVQHNGDGSLKDNLRNIKGFFYCATAPYLEEYMFLNMKMRNGKVG
jgi:hypothetical protein